VFSNPVSEPIQNGSELNEGEIGGCELVIAGRDSAEAFDAAKEVFYSVAAPVVAAVEPVAPGSPAFGSDAGPNVGNPKRRVERVRIEAAISDRVLVPKDWHQWKDRLEVVLLTRSQAEPDRSTHRVDHGGKLRVDPTFRAANGLERLPTRRIGSVLVKLDVRAINMAQLPRRITGKLLEEPGPEATRTPSSPSSIDRAPRTITSRQVAPRYARAQNVPDGCDHDAVILAWSASNVTRGHLRVLNRVRSIFLAAPKAALVTPIDL
jgi:hypothetical protein